MKYLIVLILIFLLVSPATAGQLTMPPSEELNYIRIPEIIKNITINITDNITDNISIINITDNITVINITDNISVINITDNISINITENITVINLTDNLSIINLTNLTDINITENITDNLTIIPTDILDSPDFEQINYMVTNYYYAESRLLASETNDETTYHYQDKLGSDIESKQLPFGQEIVKGERFSFTGKELDDELYYFNARYYDSDLGRFTSTDSIDENEPYSYVANNPVNYIDPDGKDPASTAVKIISFGRAYLEAEDTKQKAKVIANEGLSQGVKYTNNKIDDLNLISPAGTILKTGVGVMENLFKLGLSDEENKAEVLRNNLIEDTIMTVFKGPLAGTCYGACRDVTSTMIEFTSHKSILTPENTEELKNIEDSQTEFEYNSRRPIYGLPKGKNLKQDLDIYKENWKIWWSLQDTVKSSDLKYIPEDARNNLVIIPSS